MNSRRRATTSSRSTRTHSAKPCSRTPSQRIKAIASRTTTASSRSSKRRRQRNPIGEETTLTEQKIIDDEGHFHAEDEAIDLSDTIAEGWIALALFWLLGLTVFYQFVTRYVMNDSAAWTEEVARYMLIGVVFIGA